MARSGPFHRRDTLLAMFWPEHSADRGRNALSKAIHHLRRSLGPEAILSQGDQIGVSREHVWCDVTAFEEALESGRTEDALALYRGDLLEGFHIPGSSGFEHWSEVERSRLRRTAVASAWELASFAEQAGDGARATKFARQAVEWAPRDESGLRRLLTLLQKRGHPAEALEEFEAFARKLRRDYEIDPSGPTIELVNAIRDGSLPYDLAEPAVVVPEAASVESEAESLEAATAITQREAPTEKAPVPSTRPHTHSRSRGRLITAALAIGLVGVFALSRFDLMPFPGGEDLSETPRVLVTEFDDRTDEDLATVVAGALRVDLSQSRSLDLVERPEIAETLELMGLESSVTISAEVGREIALRDGLEAFVDGAVARAGTGYIITAAIRAGRGGRTIGSFRESVDGPDEVIPAIDRLSLGIRAALGETLDTIGVRLPLERVTTPSLEALTLYTRAFRAFDQFNNRPEATRLLRRAVILDPGFAMAWRMLGTTQQDEADQSLRLEAIRQAYDHRDRLSELERYTVEASYYATVGLNRNRQVEALQHVLTIDPENARALNNLGVAYLYMGKLELAEGVLQRATDLPKANSSLYRNLVDTRIYSGRMEAAAQALDEFEHVFPDHELLPHLRAKVQFLSGEVDEAVMGLQRVADDPLRLVGGRADAWAFLGRLAYWQGKYEEGRRAFLEAERVDTQADEAGRWARVVEAAHAAALAGDVEWAGLHIEAELGGSLPADVILDSSVVLSLTEVLALLVPSGQSHGVADELARSYRFSRVHAQIEARDTVGVRTLIQGLPLHLHRRVLLFDRLGDTDTAIELYEEIGRPGYTGWGSSPLLLRALVRLGPLFEETGDTVRSIDAYRALSQQWANGDRHARAVADQFSARAASLEREMAAGRR